MIIHINVPAIFPLAIALAYNSYLAMFMGCAGLGGAQPVLHLQDSPQLGPSEKIQFWSGVNKPYLVSGPVYLFHHTLPSQPVHCLRIYHLIQVIN